MHTTAATIQKTFVQSHIVPSNGNSNSKSNGIPTDTTTSSSTTTIELRNNSNNNDGGSATFQKVLPTNSQRNIAQSWIFNRLFGIVFILRWNASKRSRRERERGGKEWNAKAREMEDGRCIVSAYICSIYQPCAACCRNKPFETNCCVFCARSFAPLLLLAVSHFRALAHHRFVATLYIARLP